MSKPLIPQPSKRTAYMRAWRRKNAEKTAAYQKEYWAVYYQDGEVKKIASARASAWYAANKERAKARSASYYQRNKAAVDAANKRWIAKNKSKHNDYLQKYGSTRRAKIRGLTDGDIDWNAVFAAASGHCGVCSSPLFEPIEFDHIIPIAKGGRHNTSNLQVVHRRCNRRKGAKTEFTLEAYAS